VTVTDRRQTTHVLECRDADVEQFLLELDAVAVDKRQAAVVLEAYRVDNSIRWKRSGSVDTSKARWYCSFERCRLRVFMPRLGDNEHVEVIISDCTAQRGRFVAYRLLFLAVATSFDISHKRERPKLLCLTV